VRGVSKEELLTSVMISWQKGVAWGRYGLLKEKRGGQKKKVCGFRIRVGGGKEGGGLVGSLVQVSEKL